MKTRLNVAQYFELPETVRPMELLYGVVREPPAPRYGHQAIVTHLTVLLDAHVRAHALGRLCVSPIDVVLDRDRALVVQPDIIFIAADRLHIIKDRIGGAPDLVVEVLSLKTAKRDRTTKLGWYHRYGVKECWLVDPKERCVEVVDLVAPAVRRKTFSASMLVQSRVFPDFRAKAVEFFR